MADLKPKRCCSIVGLGTGGLGPRTFNITGFGLHNMTPARTSCSDHDISQVGQKLGGSRRLEEVGYIQFGSHSPSMDNGLAFSWPGNSVTEVRVGFGSAVA